MELGEVETELRIPAFKKQYFFTTYTLKNLYLFFVAASEKNVSFFSGYILYYVKKSDTFLLRLSVAARLRKTSTFFSTYILYTLKKK